MNHSAPPDGVGLPERVSAPSNDLEAESDTFVADYRTHGFCIVRRLIPLNRLSVLDTEARRLFSAAGQDEIAGLRMTRRPSVDGNEVVERIDPVCEFSPEFQALATSPDLLRLAGAAIDSHAALLKDKLIYKMPGDSGYTLHQDYPYFYECTMPPDSVTTVLIAIDPMCTENGCLSVYTGYHDGLLPPPPGSPRDAASESVQAERRREIILDRGDAVFFHSLTPHESGPNLSAVTRRALFLTYTDVCYADQRGGYYRHRRSLGQKELFK